ncbi:MAG: (Fe-S)-binding protein [Bacteroidia bacterium]|nr:(Fe-S)-binding protein [Bacteroidia bacterium]MCZ2247827.1 (Fe-S)-binding protein [Bacteroidia bacterium]
MIVDIFIPCYIDQLKPETGFNMVKILSKVGCGVNYNEEQTCCGMPAFHQGNWTDSKEIGEKFIHDFMNDRYIISPSADCTGFIKNQYNEMFHNSVLHNEYKGIQKKIYEISDFLINVLKITDLGATLQGNAVYMPTCTAIRNYGLGDEPLQLLKKVRGLNIKELINAETCCGYGGQFSFNYECISSVMSQQKIDDIIKSGADYVISTDYSCLMHLDGYIKKQGLSLTVMHLVDVLSAGWEL